MDMLQEDSYYTNVQDRIDAYRMLLNKKTTFTDQGGNIHSWEFVGIKGSTGYLLSKGNIIQIDIEHVPYEKMIYTLNAFGCQEISQVDFSHLKTPDVVNLETIEELIKEFINLFKNTLFSGITPKYFEQLFPIINLLNNFLEIGKILNDPDIKALLHTNLMRDLDTILLRFFHAINEKLKDDEFSEQISKDGLNRVNFNFTAFNKRISKYPLVIKGRAHRKNQEA